MVWLNEFEYSIMFAFGEGRFKSPEFNINKK